MRSGTFTTSTAPTTAQGSLARHFRIAGFDPIDVWRDYDDPYVLIAARPGSGSSATLANEHAPEALSRRIGAFGNAAANLILGIGATALGTIASRWIP